MSCNSTKCATCDGSCGDKPVARPSSPPMVSLPLSLYNHLVNLKDEVEKLRKQAEDPATEYDVRTMCEACVGMAKERDELKARLEFLYQEFGEAEADTFRDALELKLRITEQERDEARAEIERLRDSPGRLCLPEDIEYERAEEQARLLLEALKYPRAYLPPGEERSLALSAIMISQAETEIRTLKAEIEMLRGIGCREAKLDEPESGPCGVCLKCAEERGAQWALERHGNPFATKTLAQYAEDICRDARGSDDR